VLIISGATAQRRDGPTVQRKKEKAVLTVNYLTAMNFH
jgi:hypothetical protein